MNIIINGKSYLAEEGQSVIEVARANNIKIPNLCYHPDLTVKANCRMCVVEVKGQKGLFTSCSLPVVDGMEITTDSETIRDARRTNLELIFGQHKLECDDCILRYNCSLLEYKRDLDAVINKYPCRADKQNIYQFGPIILDQTKCIDCRNCVEACPTKYLEIAGKGADIKIVPSTDDKTKDACGTGKECIYCGQCIVHCPVGALEAEGELEEIKLPFMQKDKVVVVGVAPSIRATIGEMFGMPYGEVVTEKLVTALRKVGFNYVFDTSAAADFTTIEEVKELIDRIEKQENLPLYTSCCPSWVRYVEYNHPELIPNLTTVRSPHIIFGGLMKTYWAEKMKIDPKNIITVSIIPCTSKKFEAGRETNMVNGLRAVDYAYTTREIGFLLKMMNIDLAQMESGKLDDPLGVPSGAGVIYGASGGVMESALRTAYYMLAGKDLENLNIESVRGMKNFKKAEVDLTTKKGKKLKVKVAVLNNLKHVNELFAELKDDPHAFDYIEVMACPGGCIGGGGQPLPVSEEIRIKRAGGLYSVDSSQKLRTAHNNPAIDNVYAEYLTSEAKIKPVCHTKFARSSRSKIRKIKSSKKPYTEFEIWKQYFNTPLDGK